MITNATGNAVPKPVVPPTNAAPAAPAPVKAAGDTLAIAKKAVAPLPANNEALKKSLQKGQALGGLVMMAGLAAVGGAIFAVYMIPWAAYAALMVGGGAAVVAGMVKVFKDGVKRGEIILAERAAAKK